MRFKLTLKLLDPLRNVLPVNYQFELGSWLYRIINQNDTAFNDYIHTAGYVELGKPFRSFVFSHLMVPDRKIEGDRLLIHSQQVTLIFSTIPDKNLVSLVTEIFQDVCFLLGDRHSQVSFAITAVEELPEPAFTDKMTFRTISPLHLTQKIPGRKNDLFLSPEASDYSGLFYENLHQKYRGLYGTNSWQDPLAGKFKLRSPVTPKGITLHTETSHQTKIIGYQLRFRLQADPEVLRTGYYLGFGEKNHLGFGCCEAL